MKDTIINDTGNSRYLKSAIPADISHEELVAQLRAGTFPVDIKGLNPEGVQQTGTPVSTQTLLAPETAEALNLSQDDPTPNDAFAKMIGAAFATSDGNVVDINGNSVLPISVGSYAGTDEKIFTLTFDFIPKIVYIQNNSTSNSQDYAKRAGVCINPMDSVMVTTYGQYSAPTSSIQTSWSGKALTLGKSGNTNNFNSLDYTYYYLAIGDIG